MLHEDALWGGSLDVVDDAGISAVSGTVFKSEGVVMLWLCNNMLSYVDACASDIVDLDSRIRTLDLRVKVDSALTTPDLRFIAPGRCYSTTCDK